MSAMPLRLRHLLLSTSALTGFALASTAQAGQAALPTNGVVTVGSATIAQPNANQLNITTATSRTVIDWQSFSIGNGNKVAIQQPGSSSITVNEVTGSDPSQIFGDLSSNGRVVLANPNGIWFGPNSHVDVAGLVASTATLSADAKKAFAAGGRLSLDTAGNPTASIQNDGHITIASEGLAALVAPGVRNNGVIEATLGSVTLASGETSTLDFYGDGLVSLAVTSPVQALAIGPDGKPFQATIENKGKIAAQHVLVTADVVKGVVDNSINMSGVVEAKGVTVSGGDIVLDGGEGAVTVAGTLDATSQQAQGGNIAVTGGAVTLAATAKLDASGAKGGGTIQVGGGPHGSGNLKHAASVLVQGGSAILANATVQGNGGTVSVWSDGLTTFGGSIQAKGAGMGGNGGWVETSGHDLSITGGRVDTSSPFGQFGTWLVDPANVDIEHSSSTDGSASTTSYTGQSIVYDSDLNFALQSNGVIVASSGNLTVDTGANINWTTPQHLTLDTSAGTGNIVINGTISGTNPSSILTLNSTGTITQSAPITVGGLELLGGAAVTLNYSNSISGLAGSVGSLYLVDTAPLSISVVNGSTGLTSAGSVSIQMTPQTTNANTSLDIIDNITAASLTVQNAETGSVDVTTAITVASGATITTTGNVYLESYGSSNANGLDIKVQGPINASGSGSAITLDASYGAVAVAANLTAAGTLQLTAGTAKPLTIGVSVTASGSNFNVSAGSISIGNSATLTATSGSSYLQAEQTYSGGTVPLTISSGASVSVANSSLYLAADEVSIAGAINLGSGTLYVSPNNTGVTMVLGSSGINSAGGYLDLTPAEFQLITAGGYYFGYGYYGNYAAAITTAANLNFGAASVTLYAAPVTITNSITAGSLDIYASSYTVSLQGALVANGTSGSSPIGTISVTGGNVTIDGNVTANSTLTVNASAQLVIDPNIAVSATSFSLRGTTIYIGPDATLTATANTTSNITATATYSGSGNVPFSLEGGASISLANGALYLSADEVAIGGAIDAGTGTLSIGPYNSGVAMTLGDSAINPAGNNLDITANVLTSSLSAGTYIFGTGYNSAASITTAADLNFGSAAVTLTNGLITINNNITAGAFTIQNAQSSSSSQPAVTLAAGKTITTTAGAISIYAYGTDYDISLQGALSAGGTNGSVSVTGANVTVAGGITAGSSAYVYGSSSVSITSNITAVGNLELSAASGAPLSIASGVALHGSYFDLYGNTVSIGSNATVAATGSSYSEISAYSTYNGSGTVPFTLGSGASITMANAGLYLTADEVSIAGTINAGTGEIYIGPYNSGIAMTLGSSGINSAGSHLDLTLAELANLTAGSFEFGYGYYYYYQTTSITTAADLNFGSAAVTFADGITTINNNITAGAFTVTDASTGSTSQPVAVTLASGKTITTTAGGITIGASGTGEDISLQGALVAGGTNGSSPLGSIDVYGGNISIGASMQGNSSLYINASQALTIAPGLTLAGSYFQLSGSTIAIGANTSVSASSSSYYNDIAASARYTGSGAIPFTLGSGASITSAGGEISISADQVSIAGPINAGAGYIYIGPYNSGVALVLGAAGINSAGNELDLTSAELGELTAATLGFGYGYYYDYSEPSTITTAADLNFGTATVTLEGSTVTINNNITAGSFEIFNASTNTASSPVAITLAAGKTITATVGEIELAASGTGSDILLNGALVANGMSSGSPAGSIYVDGGKVTINGGIQSNNYASLYAETGNLTINAPVTVTGSNYLELYAVNSVLINAAVSASGSSGVYLYANYDQTSNGGLVSFGSGGSLTVNGSGYLYISGNYYTLLTAASGLANVTATGYYALANNIDASTLSSFTPIGATTAFTGVFNGLGHTISNLAVSGTSSNLGLFGTIGAGGTVGNIGLVGGGVGGSVGKGATDFGMLAGTNLGTIVNAYATGSVTGDVAGTLVGYNDGTISNSYAAGSVGGSLRVGGLVGYNHAGSITNAYSTSTVTGSPSAQYVGGLVGDNGGTITSVYAAGAVSAGSGASGVGGLVGNNSGTVTSGYWDTQVTGQSTSAAGTGLTTAQLQSGLPSGFDPTIWAITAGSSYPFFVIATATTTIMGGTETIIGTATTLTGGVVSGGTISFYANGAPVGSAVTTSSNGQYTETISSALVGTNVTLAASLTVNGNVTGLTYADGVVTTNGVSNFNLVSGETIISTSLGKLSTVTTALASAFPSSVLTSYASAVPAPAFSLTATGSFVVDQAISAVSTVELGAGGTLSLGAGITTVGGPVLINGAAVLTAATAIDTTNGGAVATGGSITFAGTLDDHAARADALTLSAGSTGDVTFDGLVGNVAALGPVTIASAADITGPAVNQTSLANGTPEFRASSFTAGTVSTPITGDFTMLGGLSTSVRSNLTAASTTGSIFINAAGVVEIGTDNDGTGGLYLIAAGAGINSTSSSSSFVAGNGGSITVTGSSLELASVQAGGGQSNSASAVSSAGGNGGAITLTATAGDIDIDASYYSPGVVANGGSSLLTSGGLGGNGGTITISATGTFVSAGVKAKGGDTLSGVGGNGGSIRITADRIAVGQAVARGGDSQGTGTGAGGGIGGSVTLIATGSDAVEIILGGNNSDFSGTATSVTYGTLNARGGETGATDVFNTDVGGTIANAGGTVVLEGSAAGAALGGTIGLLDTATTNLNLVNGDITLTAIPNRATNPASVAFDYGANVAISAGGSAGKGGSIKILGSIITEDPDLENLRINASNGTALITGSIGSATGNRLGSLVLAGNGGAITIGGSVTTDLLSDQRNGGALTISGGLNTLGYSTVIGSTVPIQLNTSGSGALSLSGQFDFTSAVDLSAYAITLTGTTILDTSANNNSLTLGTVNGGFGLTLNAGTAAVALKGAAGAQTALGGLTINAGTISLGNVTTTGAQVYNGATTLNGTYIGASFTANGVDLLGGATGVTATAGAISFNSTVDGAQALSLTDVAGTVSFGSTVGAQKALGSLTITAAGIVASNVATTGDQTYGGPINATQQSLVLSAGGNIVFDGTLASQAAPVALSILSAQNVTVLNNSTLWVTTFKGNISGTFDFGNHSLESDDVVTIQAASVDGRVVSSSATLNVDTATGVITGNSVNVTASGAVNEQITGGTTSVSDASFSGSVSATRSANIASTGDTAGTITVSGGSATVSGANVSGSVTASGLAQISATANVSADVTGGAVNIQAGQTVSGNVTSTGSGGVVIGAANVNSTIVAQGGGPVTVNASGSITGSVTGGNVMLTAPVVNENIEANTATVISPDQVLNGFIGGAPVGNAAGNITQEILGATQQVASNAANGENASNVDEVTGDTGDESDDQKKKKKKDQGAVYDYANQYIDNLVSGKPAH